MSLDAPFRIAFDNARDPLTARNALGATTNPVSTAQIADNAITNAKLADMAQATVKGRATGAGTGDPTDLTAAQVGAIIAPAWTAYTPTITASSGTFTSVSATGRYLIIGKLTLITISITITTNGTAAGFVTATLPNTAASSATLAGRENGITGKMLLGLIGGTSIIISNYDGTYAGGNGAAPTVSGSYENT